MFFSVAVRKKYPDRNNAREQGLFDIQVQRFRVYGVWKVWQPAVKTQQ